MDTRELEKQHPEAFAALPECYQADDCLYFWEVKGFNTVIIYACPCRWTSCSARSVGGCIQQAQKQVGYGSQRRNAKERMCLSCLKRISILHVIGLVCVRGVSLIIEIMRIAHNWLKAARMHSISMRSNSIIPSLNLFGISATIAFQRSKKVVSMGKPRNNYSVQFFVSNDVNGTEITGFHYKHDALRVARALMYSHRKRNVGPQTNGKVNYKNSYGGPAHTAIVWSLRLDCVRPGSTHTYMLPDDKSSCQCCCNELEGKNHCSFCGANHSYL